MDTLTIDQNDTLILDSNDTLEVEMITANGWIRGTGTLITNCQLFSGNLDPSVNLLCAVLTPPVFTVTKIGTNSFQIYLEPVSVPVRYKFQISSDSSFTDPSEHTFNSGGFQTFTGLTAGASYWLRLQIVGTGNLTFTSPWSAALSLTLASGAAQTVSFDAQAESATRIKITFPTVSGNVYLRRRPKDSQGEWTAIASNLASSPYYDDIQGTGSTLCYNTQYSYQWRTALSSWLETNAAWLTRTYSLSIQVGQIIAAEYLQYKIQASETEVLKGMD